MLLKSDIIEDAFSLLRISGLTVEPSAAENTIALRRLEGLSAELKEQNVDIGYNFTETPDTADSAGIELKYVYSLSCLLAKRMFSDFGRGKDPDASLMSDSNAAVSFLFSSTAIVNPVQHSSRMPKGSGNTRRYNSFNSFYNTVPIAPNESDTKIMIIDDIDTFAESFSAYLHAAETISSYTLEADDGLTVTDDAISASSEEIEYTVKAEGGAALTSDTYLRIKIVATTSEGRVESRVINFLLKAVEI